jgi:hypothetical protein
MLRQILFSVTLLLSVALGDSTARAQPPLLSHRDLDWSAPRRWVHVDNVDPNRIQIFERARHQWLSALRRDSLLLGDGRPLFWCARAGTVQTYFTFYPFAKWAEMDARRAMIDATEEIVGPAAMEAYDGGDSALVPPHYSQMWRRDNTWDVKWSGNTALTEATALAGRLEFRQIDEDYWVEFDSTWKEIQTALVAAHYPLACVCYANMFGKRAGETVLFWLASDSLAYRRAPSVNDALEFQVGKERSAQLLARLTKYFSVVETYEVERRTDLSNLGRP